MDRIEIADAVAETAWGMSISEKNMSLSKYWKLISEIAQELRDGTAESKEENAFMVHMSIRDGFELAPQFLEAWGLEIGRMAGSITDIASKLKGSMEGEA